ncbi:MAG TPA: Ig-like domain-containing protein, partial [Polyangia bacterium]|nr:Ig-like domain-containing protein [Polyangia bacterium]
MSRTTRAYTPLLFSLLAALLAGCPPEDSPRTLRAIAITPPAPSLVTGTELQLVATGSYDNNTTADVSAMASWTSSNPAVVTVDSVGVRGRLRGVAAGTAEISATLSGVTGRVTVTVAAAELVSLAITPAIPSLPLGARLQLVATGTFSNNTTQDLTTQVSWLSGTPDVALVNDDVQKGLALALQLGTARIVATLGDLGATTTLTVTPAVLTSIGLTPAAPSLPRGTTQDLVATGTYSDGTTRDISTQVRWSTGNPGIASISNATGTQGRVTALSPGQTPITAVLGTVAGFTTLTVTPAVLRSIGVTPAAPSLPRGATQDLIATGVYSDDTTQDLTTRVVWASSAPSVAAVSNAAGSQGQATALAIGRTTITATLDTMSGSTALTVTAAVLRSIGVTPPTSTLARGTTRTFVATGTFSDNTTQDLTPQVTWSSSDTTAAVVSNAQGSRGLVTALAPGETTIAATLGTIRGTATHTVTAATLRSIGITPASPAVPLGTTQALVATGMFSDNTTQDLTPQVTWSSSDTTVVTIGNAPGTQGLATTVAVGQATILATFNGVTGSVPLTVTPAVLVSIAVTPTTPRVILGLNLTFVATGLYTDGSTRDITPQVTWTSSDPSIATISNASGSRGRATGLAGGQTTIVATLGALSGTTTLTVAPLSLRSLNISPPTASITRGATQAFVAMGVYSDDSIEDLTPYVAWGAGSPGIASISNAPGTQGLATGLAVGQTPITATLGAVSASATLTVTPAILRSLSITPGTLSLPLDLSQPFVAIGLYSDNTTQDVTAQASWTSSNPSVAAIGNAAGTRGLAVALAAGQTPITATLGAASATATLTVTPARLA